MSENSFIFADLAGFTRLTEAHGDAEAADVAERYASASKELAKDHGAEQIKTIGDAVLMRAPDAREALSFGVRVVGEIGSQHGFPAVRVGIDHGPAEERNGDYFGSTVNVAARVAALAGASEVLLTDSVRQQAGEFQDIEVTSHGSHSLKGIPGELDIYRAALLGVDQKRGLPADPVCHMAVDPAQAASGLYFQGVHYYFCSDHCRERFVAQPFDYVDARGCILKKKKLKLRRLGLARG